MAPLAARCRVALGQGILQRTRAATSGANQSFFWLPTFRVSSLLCETIASQDRLGTNRRRDVECKERVLCHISWTTVLPMTAYALMKIEGDLSVARYWPAITRYTDNLIARARCVKRSHLISRFQSFRFKTVICQDRLLRKNVNGQTFENYRFALVSTTSARCRIRRSTGTAAALPHLAIPTSPAAG